ncbi:hypothetical protein COO60DRAFT_1030707 [Scenedesmus sp. NREL 46B-D3]|nr:hypothetical protein COO60DRAFT_1030707 [Scenedesmus sp. NREL 46B-D3]
MGQRRKHMLQTAITQDIQPPADNQQIVRALGARGGNIVEVEYPNGATTLCMMPAKFNRKLWVRRGGYLIIEPSPEAEQDAGSRVTATIAAVLYEEHVKQLKKMQGVW